MSYKLHHRRTGSQLLDNSTLGQAGVRDGDELRLCLGAPGKDRPAAFPQQPKPGEVLTFRRRTPTAPAATEPDGGKRPKGNPVEPKEKALAKTMPFRGRALRYRPRGQLLAFPQAL